MSNVLKVSLQEAIRCLHAKGWRLRRIARELGVHRKTVKGYVDGVSKCTTHSTTGSEAVGDPKCTTISTAGSEGAQSGSGGQALSAGTKPGRRSVCEALREVVEAKVEAGLSAQCVYQDLVTDHEFGDSYESVKRFVRKLKAKRPARVWRMECNPGEEAQVDFGLGAPIVDEQGKRTRTWVLRVVLSHSRKGYSEAVLRQDTETFLRVLENAIRSFGGAPLTLSVDNLKAAVTKADWYDPEINPKLAQFCRHYGVSVLPCRPYTPQHKGKVERGVGYVKENALKGRVFKSLREQNQHLLHWEAAVADKRIHGTTRQQVEARFEQERPHLLPLPESLFPCFMEAQRNVSRDSFVEVAKAYYEAPPELIGRKVWVRWDVRCVRIFNERMEQVAMHTRLEPGRFSRSLGAGGWSTPVRGTCKHWVSQASVLGEHCGQWAQAAADARGPEAIRAIMGVCGLVKKHSATAVDAACAKALRNGSHSYKGIKALLGQEVEQSHLGFAESHPLIRNLGAYGDFINQTQTQTQTNDTSNQHPQTPCPEAAPVRAA
jgi:transposase